MWLATFPAPSPCNMNILFICDCLLLKARLCCQAFKQGMYGKRYVWIIIGWYDDSWWERDLETEGVSCDVREMRMAVDGYLATDHMNLNEDDVTSKEMTVSGLVRNLRHYVTKQCSVIAIS